MQTVGEWLGGTTYEQHKDDWMGTGWDEIWRLFMMKVNIRQQKMEQEGTPINDLRISSKEKYGALRVDIDGFDELLQYAEELEEESIKICTDCGVKGTMREINGWLSPRCNKHAKQKENAVKRMV